jgi:hypothetical protein
MQKSVKTMPTNDGGQSMKQKKLLEPTIGLEPMTCRLRISRWVQRFSLQTKTLS